MCALVINRKQKTEIGRKTTVWILKLQIGEFAHKIIKT